jgi:alkylated DNA repair protein alkB family protein 6
VQLRGRWLLNVGGVVAPRGLTQQSALPPWLDALAAALVDAGCYPLARRPNHVLINEYAADEGIMPHTDGPAYHPCTATVSLGSPALMRFLARADGRDTPVAELLLRPRSLVVFSGEAYSSLLHSISEAPREAIGRWAPCLNAAQAGATEGEELERRGVRLSLTFRHVRPAAEDQEERGKGRTAGEPAERGSP